LRAALIHLGFFYNGGGERTVLQEAIGLQDRGHEVEVYCPTSSGDCYPELMSLVKVHELCWWLDRRLAFRDALGMLLSSLLTPSIVGRFRDFDVILAHSQPSNWLAYNVWRRFKVPYVSYLHQTNRFLYPREVDRETGWSTNSNMQLLAMIHSFRGALKRLDSMSIRGSEMVLTNSEWIKGQIADVYGVEADVCHPGVDLSRFEFSTSLDEVVEDPYILSTNRHYPQKGLHYLIRGFARLLKARPWLRCVITGSHTSYTGRLMEYASDLGVRENVVFTDNLSEKGLADAYRRAYVYTYTSPEEDFGLGPIEAGACRVPSVVWDHAGPRETVVEGETGFRVRPYDVDELVERQLQLIDDVPLRFKMGERAARFVRENFSWERHVDRLESALYSVLS